MGCVCGGGGGGVDGSVVGKLHGFALFWATAVFGEDKATVLPPR